MAAGHEPLSAEPAGQEWPGAFRGPFDSVTEPFTVRNRHGATVRGTLSRPARRADGGGADGSTDSGDDGRSGSRAGTGPPPVAVVVAGLGRPRLWTALPGLHLLANGFTVVRFDLTNSVGVSDGDILDFTLTRACEDLCDVARWARDRCGTERVTAVTASITGRAALRAAALEPDLFALVGTLCGVVDVRATLTALLSGRDLVGQLHRGDASGLDGVGTLFGHDIRLRGVEGLVRDDWAGTAGTVRDLRTASRTRFVDFHAGGDPWIRRTDVRAVYDSVPHARTFFLPDAGHELNPAQTRRALAVLLRAHRALSGPPPGGRPRPPLRTPTTAQVSAQRRAEKALDRWWLARQRPGPGSAPVTAPAPATAPVAAGTPDPAGTAPAH